MYGKTPCNSSECKNLSALAGRAHAAEDIGPSHDIHSEYSNYLLAFAANLALPWAGRSPRTARRAGAQILGSLAHHGPDPIGSRHSGRGHAAALPHGLKLNQVRYVLSAAEQGSFRRAAADLNIQQSTISRRIRELEDRLGAAIFERDASGVRLTRAGGRFLERARRAVEHLAEAADAVGAAGRAERGVLRIGVVAPLGPGFLDALLARILAERAAGRVVVVEASPQAHQAALSLRRLDIAFLADPPPADGLATRHLWSERLVAVMRADHALSRKAVVSWTDLERQAVLVPDDPLGREIEGRRPPPAVEDAGSPRHVASADTLLRLAALGQGVVVAVESVAARLDDHLICRPLLEEAVGFSAVWSPRNEKLALRRALKLASDLSAPPPCLAAAPAGRGRSPDPSS